MMLESFRPIGYLQTPFSEKFGIPRQPGLAPSAVGTLKLLPWVGGAEVVRGLEGFSHVWVLFLFHEARDRKTMVRPPRLGGREKVGVFASRSPHRPNPIGLSVVQLRRIHLDSGVVLELGGLDVLDGTPVLDVKPYLPYADAIPEARAGWADAPLFRTEVGFSAQGEAALLGRPDLKERIREVLSLDPRPNSHQGRVRPGYTMRMGDVELRWRLEEDRILVEEVKVPGEEILAVSDG